MNQKTTNTMTTNKAPSAVLPETMTGDSAAADQLHQIFNSLPVYSWQTIKDIPFKDGIYIVFEKGETYKGLPRIVRVGTHTSSGRLKQRLRSHFLSEHHNSSIFRKNIGKVLQAAVPIGIIGRCKDIVGNALLLTVSLTVKIRQLLGIAHVPV